MGQVLKRVDKGQANLLVSTICIAEVLDEVGKSDAGRQMLEFIKRSNVVPAAADVRVAKLAAEFRQRARQSLMEGRLSKSIKAPDAIIVATAVIYRASELHSFDPLLIEASESDIVGGLLVTDDLSEDRQQRLFQ